MPIPCLHAKVASSRAVCVIWILARPIWEALHRYGMALKSHISPLQSYSVRVTRFPWGLSFWPFGNWNSPPSTFQLKSGDWSNIYITFVEILSIEPNKRMIFLQRAFYSSILHPSSMGIIREKPRNIIRFCLKGTSTLENVPLVNSHASQPS